MNRRQFLGMTSATALAATCSPNLSLSQAAVNHPQQTFSSSLKSMQTLTQEKNLLLGYPINMNTPPEEFFAWRKELFDIGLDQFSFNNVGNPYDQSRIPFNSHRIEKELINRFGMIYGFSPDNLWGFLTNSGTDSNMHGIYMGRTILKSQTGVMPKIYFTREAHYSIQILGDLLNLEWVEVGADKDGSMDIGHLEQQLKANPDQPALVVATIGTTFKGAIDSIDEIQSKLKDRAAYLHLDAALFGGYLPFTPFASSLFCEIPHLRSGKKIIRYDSIAVSCHKFYGFPSPAGLFITSKMNFETFQSEFAKVHDPEYIHQVPGTITCSRDAVKPAEFLYFSSQTAFQKQAIDAKAILDNADYLLKEIKLHYSDLYPQKVNSQSNIVYFRKPSDAVISRYSLATMTIAENGKKAPYSHVVVMPHATRDILDQFLTDLAS